jgi:hypothetical protein
MGALLDRLKIAEAGILGLEHTDYAVIPAQCRPEVVPERLDELR